MFQDILPLSLAADWQREPHAPVADNTASWLFESGSLTRRLKQHCKNFRVKVLAKHELPLSQVNPGVFAEDDTMVQVREVLLYCDHVPWVYAQTLMPLNGIPPVIDELITLGEKPLGELIFTVPGMTRSAIEAAPFDLDSPVGQLSERLAQHGQPKLWGRRSLFHVEDYALLVAEVFLPEAEAYR